MYICVCRGISDSDVREAVQEGAQSAKGVFRSCGKKPRCGKCVSHLNDHVTQESASVKIEYGFAAE